MNQKSKKAAGRPGPDPLGSEMGRAREIFYRLRALYRDLARRDGRNGSPAGEAEPILSIPFDPAGEPDAFARRLIDTVRARAPGRGGGARLQPGRVYCYNCESSGCEHGRPPNHLSVFAGYGATGFPEWTEFVSVLLARRDSRLNNLVDGGETVAILQGPEELKAGQLKVFGKESALYDILGQVVAGYLPLPRGRGRMAVTVQAVRCLERGRPRLRLNAVGRASPDFLAAGAASGGAGSAGGPPSDLVDLLKLEPEVELEGLFASTRKRLEDLELKLRFRDGAAGKGAGPRGAPARDRAGEAEAVRPALNHLARGIESIFRRRQRRTRHAMERRAERPAVGLALKDLARAGSDSLLFDEREHTFIVIGPKWRVHVFGRDGRHVTSLVLSRDGMRRRIDARRWRYTTSAESAEIRARAAELIPRNGKSSGGEAVK